MALTQQEKARIRYHLGFPNISAGTQLGLGFPAAGHPAYLLESAMDDILPEAEPKVREVLAQCECIERQMMEAKRRLIASSVGEVDLRGPEELEALEDQYDYWTDALVDIFGVNKNPFSKKHQRMVDMYTVVGPS